MAYAVIAENDESKWEDETGVLYHFPKRYVAILTPGTQVIYYKGKLRNQAFAPKRLSPEPHYFGTASIARVFPDTSSTKGDLFATIEDFLMFGAPVPIRQAGQYFEEISPSRAANHWRDGVRSTSRNTYLRILADAGLSESLVREPKPVPWISTDDDLESALEGSKTLRYVTTYERQPRYRRQAIAIHGLRCKGCGLHMGETYGALGEGFIHVHHIHPVSEFDAPKRIDPATDLVPVCPNCHALIHRKKTSTLSVDDLKAAIAKQRLQKGLT